MARKQYLITVGGNEPESIEPVSSQPGASRQTSSQPSNLRQTSLSFGVSSSSPAIAKRPRTVGAATSRWTTEEDKRLLRAERAKITPVRRAIAHAGLNKTENAYRNRRVELKKKYPDLNPPAGSERTEKLAFAAEQAASPILRETG